MRTMISLLFRLRGNPEKVVIRQAQSIPPRREDFGKGGEDVPLDNLTTANQHRCVKRTDPNSGPSGVQALSAITMNLMQKYVKGGAVGIDNILRWPLDSAAVAFLLETTSAASAKALLKLPLLDRDLDKESLIGIMSLAQICRRGIYDYSARTQ